jgi:hypothetical protein
MYNWIIRFWFFGYLLILVFLLHTIPFHPGTVISEESLGVIATDDIVVFWWSCVCYNYV